MRIRPTTIIPIIGGLGLVGLGAFRNGANSDVAQIIGLSAVVLTAIVLVALMIVGGRKRLAQMRIVADRTGFTLLPSRTPLFGDTPAALFGISRKSDKWPASADFAGYFPGFSVGIKRSGGPAVYGTDSNGVTWFILQYEYTDSSYHGTSQYFALVFAKTNLTLPHVSMMASNGGRRPSIAGRYSSDYSSQIKSGTNNRFDVRTAYPAGAAQLMTPGLVEVMQQLPQYDYEFSGPYIMACLCDEDRSEILLSMKASIEKIIEALQHQKD